MSIAVSLWSNKVGELKNFLERYYQKDVKMEEDVGQWVYIYSKPLDAIDIISAAIDNNDKYKLGICIQIDKGDLHNITVENHNDVIKGILQLYYKEPDVNDITY
ncbi:MAG TPA: hypothetical protein VHT34_06175 [Clostridia bacterium]|nr:hypothetical protein [Clostridia bacterium]